MDLKRVFHKVLREYRLKKELSQAKLADRMDMCLSTIRRWDVGTAVPDVVQYFQLLEILGDEMHVELKKRSIKKA